MVDALRALYGGKDDALDARLRLQLVECGEALASQLAELAHDWTPERAGRIQMMLAAASAHIRQLAAMET